MQLAITVDRSSDVPIQAQIIAQMRDLIERGILAGGTRVPSTRELAHQLGVARRTIVLAYEKLIAEGYLESRRSAATFVSVLNPRRAIHVGSDRSDSLGRRQVPAPSAVAAGATPNLYVPVAERCELDFTIGRPDHRLFPSKLWQRLMVEHLGAHARVISEYPDPQGHFGLRRALCEHLRVSRGIQCSEDQIVIVSGVQDGLNLICRLLHTPRGKVIVEDPCYSGAAAAFETQGFELVPAPVDQHGIIVSNWPQNASIVYVTPSHQFPYGVTMSLERRHELLAWVYSTRAYVVEDDYDSDFRYSSSPLFALTGIDVAHRVIYLGTFSKSIGPGLRMGYAVFPKHLAAAARALKATMSNGLPILEQAVVSQFITSGAFQRHLVLMRRQYLARRDKLIATLLKFFPDSSISGEEGGMHLIWTLGKTLPPAPDLAKSCRQSGVGIHPIAKSPISRSFAPPSLRDVMLGYTCLTEEQIDQAVERIQRAVRSVSLPNMKPALQS